MSIVGDGKAVRIQKNQVVEKSVAHCKGSSFKTAIPLLSSSLNLHTHDGLKIDQPRNWKLAGILMHPKHTL